MRISSLQVFNSGVSNMQKGQSSLAKLQEQISTGKNLNRPSDDPVAAAQILNYRRELAASDNYQQNISVSQRRLEQEEVVLQQVKDAGDRLKELALRANNGTMTAKDRTGIATEAEQVQQFILGLMNTKDSQGEYLFSGTKGETQPFVADGQGGFSYMGDSEARLIQTGPSTRVQSTDTGRDLFQVVPGDVRLDLLNTTATAPAGFSLSITPAGSVDAEPEFEEYIASNGKSELTLTVDATLATYTLLDSAGVTVSSGAIAPATTSVVEMSPPGLSLDLGSAIGALAADVTTTIRPAQPRHSILTTSQTLIDTLRAPIKGEEGLKQFAADMADVLSDIDIAQEGVVSAHTQLGGRMVMLEQQESINAEMTIFTQAVLSSLEDLDYAAAISKFSFQEVALQAAQQTFARVNQLSLFNYL